MNDSENSKNQRRDEIFQEKKKRRPSFRYFLIPGLIALLIFVLTFSILYFTSTWLIALLVAASQSVIVFAFLLVSGQRQHARFDAEHDALTGLRNRMALRDEFEELANKDYPIQVLLMDIDNFKKINDRFGHMSGDIILQIAGEKLRSIFGEGCYRYGGDEFLIIAPAQGDPAPRIERLLGEIHVEAMEAEGIAVTCSAGYVSGTCSGTDMLRQMIVQADAWLYQVKKTGKGRCLGSGFDTTTRTDMMTELPGQGKVSQPLELDYVTKLPSREAFLRKSEELILSSAGKINYAFLFFDIDNFRSYNAQYGYERGDSLLYNIGLLLQDIMPNRLISHFSDDHFAALILREEIPLAMNNMLDQAALENGESIPELYTGIYLFQDGDNVVTSCDRAKIACDNAKARKDKDWSYFNEEMEIQRKHEHYVLSTIERAMEEGWIRPYYQPIVRVLNGKITEAEALCRWVDPQKDFIPPDQFIPVLERAHKIHDLDMHMLNLVCRDLAESIRMGIQVVPVSVNLSRVDFERPDLIYEIESILNKHKVPANLICIEVLERDLGDLDMNLTEITQQLRSRGFHVWIDDFGSGLSSLNALKEMSFDLVKLDMLFLRGMTATEDDEANKHYMRVIMGMLKQLGSMVLSEGVETEYQREMLRENGCNKAQGYLYSKPLPIDIFRNEWLSREDRIETIEDRRYYDAIGKENLLRPTVDTEEDPSFPYASIVPSIVVEILSGKEIRIIQTNRSAVRMFAEDGKTIPEVTASLNLQTNSMRIQLLKMEKILLEYPKEWHNMDFAGGNGNYFMSRVHLVAREEQRRATAITVTMMEISRYSEMDHRLLQRAVDQLTRG